MEACVQGHELMEGANFCSVCGGPRLSLEATHLPDPAVVLPTPPRRERKGLGTRAIVGISLASTFALAGAAVGIVFFVHAARADAKGYTVNGDLTLTSVDALDGDDTSCKGAAGFDDIVGGAQIVVTDGAGQTLGLAKLSDGRTMGAVSSILERPTECSFAFHVVDVAKGKTFYKVEVSHRGQLQYTEAQIAHGGIHLTLGD